ncbi:uncharacterized protein LOC120699009 isoform X9 [Panicum virgatum]|uniref:Myb/SANT-like domain-containing protein n=1 Tax=Panicum virgatum TaxID=38727 RepID=A0A8T0V1G7_PANVG|nr:uncharacterized protein LOC120699009 isoform X9 [Panicum virgatum]KAG2628208.1 hypothetical protein PVAP13_3KG234427 [Panicum virgatum]
MRRPIPFLGTTRTPRSSPHPVAQRRPPEAWPARRMGTQGTDSTWGSSNFPRTPVYAPFPNPPRHSTSSSAPWQGGPYASLPPIPRPAAPSSYGGYSEGCSGYAPWYAPPMGNDPASSAVPGHPRTRSQSRRQAASPVPDRSSNNDSMASDGGDDDLASKGSIRAKWDDVRTEIFCHLWLEEQQKGNCLQGKMSAIGWCNMVAAFKERMGWAHSKNQLHTRYRQLKKYYGVLKILKRGTGGGRRKHGGFKAAPDIWDALKKKLSEVERLKREEPSWLWMLDDMFRDATIDYSTMLATAGEPNTDNVDSHDTTAADSISPRTTSGSCKRGSSEATKSTADSPSKKAQAPMSPSSSITPEKKENSAE